MNVAAVVVAAGRGERLGEAGHPRAKALVEVEGRPLVAHAVAALRAVREVAHVVVVHTAGDREPFAAALGDDVRLVVGGATRSASVRHGVAAVPDDVELIAVHDAARALVPAEVIRATIAAVRNGVVAAAPGLPVPDTLKRVRNDGDVIATVDRAGLWAVHTPQVVRRDVLVAALAWAGDRTTSDDLALVEEAIAAGVVPGRVRLVPGDPRDLKVTYPADLEVAAAIIAARSRVLRQRSGRTDRT